MHPGEHPRQPDVRGNVADARVKSRRRRAPGRLRRYAKHTHYQQVYDKQGSLTRTGRSLAAAAGDTGLSGGQPEPLMSAFRPG
jgi:hypothetical protein